MNLTALSAMFTPVFTVCAHFGSFTLPASSAANTVFPMPVTALAHEPMLAPMLPTHATPFLIVPRIMGAFFTTNVPTLTAALPTLTAALPTADAAFLMPLPMLLNIFLKLQRMARRMGRTSSAGSWCPSTCENSSSRAPSLSAFARNAAT